MSIAFYRLLSLKIFFKSEMKGEQKESAIFLGWLPPTEPSDFTVPVILQSDSQEI